jgi:hypothetical protein
VKSPVLVFFHSFFAALNMVMARAQPVNTPHGAYASVAKAAAACGLDPHTVLTYLEQGREGWSRVQLGTVTVPGMSWAQYRTLTDDQREAHYQAWCSRQGLDPDLESTANQFVDGMPETDQDIVPEPEEEDS